MLLNKIANCRAEIEHDGEFVKRNIIVETDIELDPSKVGYDKEKEKELIDEVGRILKEHDSTIDGARIIQRK